MDKKEKIEEIPEERLQKLEKVKSSGVSPYGGRFKRTHSIADLNEEMEGEVIIAGRLIAIRKHGKSIFFDLWDGSAVIQIYLNCSFIGEEKYNIFQEGIDIGDFIGITGEVFRTRMGELSVKASNWTLLTKTMRPLPAKWHGLKDVEIKYRQRYLDLIANAKAREVFALRSSLTKELRRWLDEQGFTEVETPILQAIPGGAAGKPFRTYQDALKMELFLRIAPELYLKQLLVGGEEKVYDLNKSFRNEGLSTRHNPEFTMLELYEAYADYEYMMEFCEKLILNLADTILGKRQITYQGMKIDLSPPWRRITFNEALRELYNVDIKTEDLKSLTQKLRAAKVEIPGENITRSGIVRLLEKSLASTFPTFIIDYPAFLCPLAKRKKDNLDVCERFELFAGGIEIANAYSELADPIEQRKRLYEQADVVDEGFLLALEHGMPPASGMGIGIDRLIMLFTDSASVRDVILFPQLGAVTQD
ncbi:MAG: Lysine--tRNA ligase [Syntrophomonadaceae bacterium]|nr:Lysine--tRNA ligase [Bacillota bacterium]MBT9146635.1 Lysine--tRNA ligase [Bacillota bacterium]